VISVPNLVIEICHKDIINEEEMEAESCWSPQDRTHLRKSYIKKGLRNNLRHRAIKTINGSSI
jgi:hypothetical protein